MTWRSPRGDYLMIRVNHCNAGFFAQVQFALNQLRYAERKGLIPVVDFGPDSVDGPNAYYEAAAGPNVWEYYFEPIGGLTPAAARDEAGRSGRRVLALKYWEQWRLHRDEPRSVFTYPYGYYRAVVDKTAVVRRGMVGQPAKRGATARASLYPCAAGILSKVETVCRRHFRGPVLGVPRTRH